MFGRNDARDLRRGALQYLPVVPGRMEFAEVVRRTILLHPPEVVAVELPATLENTYRRGVARLPEMSVIFYEEPQQEQTVYIPVEITDPFVEAIRSALEVGAEVVCVDPDLGDRPHLRDDYPDPYSICRIGYWRFIETYRVFPQPQTSDLQRHAAGIAWKLQGLDPGARVLVVLSLNLLDPVLDAMEMPQAEPLARVQRKGVQIFNLHPDCLSEVLTECPLLESVYEIRRFPLPEEETPLSHQVESPFVQGAFRVFEPEDPDDPGDQLARMIHRLSRHSNRLHEGPATRGEQEEPPAVSLLGPPLDRQKFQFRLFAEAEKCYTKSSGEKVTHWQRRLLARFSRNLALVSRMLVASPFDLTVAARSVVDDNFAWEFWQLAASSPFQKLQSDLTTVNISGEEVWLDMKRIRLRRRLANPKARPKPMGLRPRKKEQFPGQWAQQFDGQSICSYPPEDLKLEEYGAFLKKKGKSILSAERSRVEPFTVSLLDGIDLRETLRNWHEKKLYVREFQRVTGEVGAIVVIFEEDKEGRYNWGMTWLGEHSQESDMAFYSTDPASKVVGPGIARAEYGGFLLSYPPRRMVNVWHDPDYWLAENKPETLLLAALDYSLEKYVVYVAARPPRSIFKNIASRLGKKIIYIPIGQLSPVSLKKIRVAHILDGHDKRKTAKEYIW